MTAGGAVGGVGAQGPVHPGPFRSETAVGNTATGDAGPSTHTHGLPRRVHPGLLRTVLYAGVERPVIALEATVAVGLVATIGPRVVTLLAIVLIVGVVHPIMAWVTSKDPLATAIYVRSLRWRDYYVPHAGVGARARVRPTLPRV